MLFIFVLFFKTLAQNELKEDTTNILEEVKYMRLIIEQHYVIHKDLSLQIQRQNDKILNLENKINEQDQRINDLQENNLKLKMDADNCSRMVIENIPDDQCKLGNLGYLGITIER